MRDAAHATQERIFVVHGGLFPHDGVTLNHIKGMSRKREPPIHGNSFEDQVSSTRNRAKNAKRPTTAKFMASAVWLFKTIVRMTGTKNN